MTKQVNGTAKELIELRRGSKSVRQTCIQLVEGMGIDHKYLEQIAYHGYKPSDKVARKIMKLHASIQPKKPRICVTVDLPTIEDKEKVLKLSMKERAERLLED